jgi:hypothetical protein
VTVYRVGGMAEVSDWRTEGMKLLRSPNCRCALESSTHLKRSGTPSPPAEPASSPAPRSPASQSRPRSVRALPLLPRVNLRQQSHRLRPAFAPYPVARCIDVTDLPWAVRPFVHSVANSSVWRGGSLQSISMVVKSKVLHHAYCGAAAFEI